MLPTSQSIRLIALPLSKNSKSLVYFYAQQLPSPDQQTSNRIAGPVTLPAHTSQLSPSVLIKRLTDAGVKQWNKLATSADGSWKLKIYNTGERMMDKIPFEEWALKSIDPPSISSQIRPPGIRSQGEVSSTAGQEKFKPITLLYPGSLCMERELMSGLQRSMAENEPYHRKWMKLNIFLSPLTLPCAIVPLIPNLPFFYMMWRSWSHWRAYKAARYLNQMIQSGLVHPISSPILDTLYAHTQKEAKNAPRKRRNAKDAKDDVPAENEIILSQDMVLKLQKQLDLPPESAVDIFRGIHQARQRLEDLATNPNNTARSSADSKHSSP
ncbi:hypothetical protein PCANC_12229 [Puccinia coronata f. sp. avenae]|uniref:Mitochondrial K+-H+ exchange-related-domain-containing protein n=1 Tax=Puccinia coronata f. sp. avenae TaxID=200324 RepID=A0A2N5UAC5_9BASI|nr:hypothetical protein PCANC_12229 [Puccinia coronata f. sp. avenae]PLW44695.1 hypothetical protein PCASD_05856 [Puccinia coronata f. sp. avenae]